MEPLLTASEFVLARILSQSSIDKFAEVAAQVHARWPMATCNILEQDHRAIRRRCAAMVRGFKYFGSAAITLAGIELAHRIRKRQFSFGRGRYQNFGSLRQI
jgi:transposase-like protein